MKNYVQRGDVLDYVATATITSGDVIEFTDCIGVAAKDAVSGATVAVAMTGVFNLAKVAATAWSLGDKLYWDATNNELTTTATANIPVGIAAADAASADTTAKVLLNPGV